MPVTSCIGPTSGAEIRLASNRENAKLLLHGRCHILYLKYSFAIGYLDVCSEALNILALGVESIKSFHGFLVPGKISNPH